MYDGPTPAPFIVPNTNQLPRNRRTHAPRDERREVEHRHAGLERAELEAERVQVGRVGLRHRVQGLGELLRGHDGRARPEH